VWSLRLLLARGRPYGLALAAKALLVATLLAGFLYADYRIFRRLFTAARQIETLTPFFALGLIENFLSLVFLIATFVLFFSAMTAAIGSLFMDLDLEIWHAAPVTRLRVAAARWGKTLVQSSYLVFFFLIPILVALQLELGKTIWFTLAGAGGLLALLVTPVSLAAILILLLVRFFPVRRVHQIAMTLAIIVFSGVIVALRVARPERLFQEFATDDVVAILQAIRLPGASVFPGGWLAGAIMGAPWLYVRLFAIAAVSLALYLWLAHRFYFRAFVRAKETSAPTALGAGPMTRLLDRALAGASPQTRAMLGKEARVVTRDAAQWSQLFMMVALLFLYLYNIQMIPLEGDFRAALLAYLNLGMAGFVIAAICLRFAFPSLSAEGKQFWILESAPISFRRILWTKVGVYLFPLLGVGLLLTVLANLLLDASAPIWAWTLAGSVLSTCGLTAMGVGMGAIAPNFKSENPMEVAVSLGGLAYMAVSMLYVGTIMVLLARPFHRFLTRIILGNSGGGLAWLAPLGAALALSLLVALVPIEIAVRRHALMRRI
jgi:ABC-2 type transport system permease protein